MKIRVSSALATLAVGLTVMGCASSSRPTPTKPALEALAQYMNSRQRLVKIYSAVKSFGEVVLMQSQTDDSKWAPFNASCSEDYEGFSNPRGYRAGDQLTPGDDCHVQHNPNQYGGPRIQVDADVLVGQHGEFTNTFVGVTAHSSLCWVNVRYIKGDPVPVIELYNLPYPQTSYEVRTLGEAMSLTNSVVKCLNSTRP